MPLLAEAASLFNVTRLYKPGRVSISRVTGKIVTQQFSFASKTTASITRGKEALLPPLTRFAAFPQGIRAGRARFA